MEPKIAWLSQKYPPYWTFGFNADVKSKRGFVAYFHYTGWENMQLGISLNVKIPNLEVHIPCGFVRIGWSMRVERKENQ